MIASEVPAIRATVLGSGFGVSATSWPLVRLTWITPIDWSIWLILPIELGGLLETASSLDGFLQFLAQLGRAAFAVMHHIKNKSIRLVQSKNITHRKIRK